jgi:arsenite methyltransferase
VDVVISNCVLNLSAQKEQAIAEAFRVLKPSGRFAVSDMIFLGQESKLPADLLRNTELWSGCISGALEQAEYEELLSAAGFEDISLELTQTYDAQALAALSGCCGEGEQLAAAHKTQFLHEVRVASASVRARKPQHEGNRGN